MLSATTPTPILDHEIRTVFDCPQPLLQARAGTIDFQVALPLLAGPNSEPLLMGGAPVDNRHGLNTFTDGSLLAGFGLARNGLELGAAATDLYQRLFLSCQDLHLYRIWNFVPRINTLEAGLENYRHFCRGRSLAFERRFGTGFQLQLPAASAVGTTTGPLAVAFLAGPAEPRHFENPRQIPAFKYPPQYGPRPPSFTRATSVACGHTRCIFISGTAAIIGHESIGKGDLDRQIDCLLENLRLIAAEAGAGPGIGSAHGWQRAFRIYLRQPTDLAATQTRLNHDLLRAGDTMVYLQADICRAELLLEIEAVLTAPTG